MKKGQVTLWVILGFVVVMVASVMMFGNAPKIVSTQGGEVISFSQMVQQVESTRDECIKTTIREAITYNTLYPSPDNEARLENDINGRLESCVDVNSIEGSYNVLAGIPDTNVDITEGTIHVYGNFDISLEGDGQSRKIKEFDYTFDKGTVLDLKTDGEGKTTEDLQAVSNDVYMKINIPKGTIFEGADGPLKELPIKIMDKAELSTPEFSANNLLIPGGKVYNMPHVVMNQPVEVCIRYEQNGVDSERDLTLGYYDEDVGIWKHIPSTVDLTKDTVCGQVNHFSAIANIQRYEFDEIAGFYMEHIYNPCGMAPIDEDQPENPESDKRYIGLFNEPGQSSYEQEGDTRWKLNNFCEDYTPDLNVGHIEEIYRDETDDWIDYSIDYNSLVPASEHCGDVYATPQMKSTLLFAETPDPTGKDIVYDMEPNQRAEEQLDDWDEDDSQFTALEPCEDGMDCLRCKLGGEIKNCDELVGKGLSYTKVFYELTARDAPDVGTMGLSDIKKACYINYYTKATALYSSFSGWADWQVSEDGILDFKWKGNSLEKTNIVCTISGQGDTVYSVSTDVDASYLATPMFWGYENKDTGSEKDVGYRGVGNDLPSEGDKIRPVSTTVGNLVVHRSNDMCMQGNVICSERDVCKLTFQGAKNCETVVRPSNDPKRKGIVKYQRCNEDAPITLTFCDVDVLGADCLGENTGDIPSIDCDPMEDYKTSQKFVCNFDFESFEKENDIKLLAQGSNIILGTVINSDESQDVCALLDFEVTNPCKATVKCDGGDCGSDDGSTDDGSTDDGSTDDGDSEDDGSTDDGDSEDDGSADDGSTDDGDSEDDGSADDGSSDDGSQDDGSSDDGSQDDGSSDDGSQDDGSSDDGSNGENNGWGNGDQTAPGGSGPNNGAENDLDGTGKPGNGPGSENGVDFETSN
ncbi:MAG: hypothetical protein ABIJ34_07590 [archaeon]